MGRTSSIIVASLMGSERGSAAWIHLGHMQCEKIDCWVNAILAVFPSPGHCFDKTSDLASYTGASGSV